MAGKRDSPVTHAWVDKDEVRNSASGTHLRSGSQVPGNGLPSLGQFTPLEISDVKSWQVIPVSSFDDE
jgi:hypothetical protein